MESIKELTWFPLLVCGPRLREEIEKETVVVYEAAEWDKFLAFGTPRKLICQS
jgi:hypothetical protein